MSALKLLPLGGMGNVTQNMYVYEYEDEILLVDCGIGFPDHHMPGVDVLIPDIAPLLSKLEEGKKIVGMILTHGHDDHIGALPYILPDLPAFPIYASPLTAGFAQNRMRDGGAERSITVVDSPTEFEISQHFSAQAIAITHSVPDTRHYAITTPAGIIYHGSDFKLDATPVDHHVSDLARISELGQKNVLCMLIDCLRVERPERTKSESTVGPVIERAMMGTQGKFIVTLMSSHIHRIQQVVDAAAKHGRKIAFVGRSVEQNVEVATVLGKLIVPKGLVLDKRDIQGVPDKEVCLIIAGSQGQEGSSLVRAVFGEHPTIQIKPNDKVVFSADAIPGNEVNFFGAIDELCRNGIDVIYPDIEPDIHQSGHASAPEQLELLQLLKPKFVMPIGGADRHRVKFVQFVAEPAGYNPSQVLIPGHGDVLAFEDGQPSVAETISLTARTVDGLGIGDVGPVVLSDRRAMSQAGIIVLVIPRRGKKLQPQSIMVVSRGFVFMKEAEEVVSFIQKTSAAIISELGAKANQEDIKRAIERRLARKLYKIIQREPMIVPVIVDM